MPAAVLIHTISTTSDYTDQHNCHFTRQTYDGKFLSRTCSRCHTPDPAHLVGRTAKADIAHLTQTHRTHHRWLRPTPPHADTQPRTSTHRDLPTIPTHVSALRPRAMPPRQSTLPNLSCHKPTAPRLPARQPRTSTLHHPTIPLPQTISCHNLPCLRRPPLTHQQTHKEIGRTL